MNRRIGRAVFCWVLTLLWMGFIFLMSAQTGETSAELSGSITETIVSIITPDYDSLSESEQMALVDGWHTVVRKTAHFCEYAVLGVLLFYSFLYSSLSMRYAALFAVLVAVLYAAGDEWHQSFVDCRGPSLADVGIDSLGAVFGVLISGFVRAVKRRNNTKKEIS